MKVRFLMMAIFCFVGMSNLSAQSDTYSTFYYQRVSLFEKLPVDSTDIIFLGNSITNGGEWCELFPDKHVINRGISGDRAPGVFDRLYTILPGKPAKIFLLIGINDLAHGASVDSVLHSVIRIAEKVKSESPNTKLYIQSILPVNNTFNKFPLHVSKGTEVIEANKRIEDYCKNNDLVFIDLYSSFKNTDDEQLNPEFTNDGLHLKGEAYLLWKKLVTQYVYEL